MSVSENDIVVGGLEDEEDNVTDGGIIAAYVLFAVGAFVMLIVVIWLIYYGCKRRYRLNKQPPTSTYPGSTLRPVSELPTITYAKPTYAVTNGASSHHDTVHMLENGVPADGGFTTLTRPAATSTAQRAYLVNAQDGGSLVRAQKPPPLTIAIPAEDAVDSARVVSRPLYSPASAVSSSLKPVAVKKAYLVTENRPGSRAMSALNLEAGGRQQRLLVEGGLRRAGSDPRLTRPVTLIPAASASEYGGATLQRTLVPVKPVKAKKQRRQQQQVYSVASSRHGGALTEPVLVSRTAPRSQRLNTEPTYYIVNNSATLPAKTHQVQNWVMAHQDTVPTPSPRGYVTSPRPRQQQQHYSHISRSVELLDGDEVFAAPVTRARSLDGNLDNDGEDRRDENALYQRWTPDMAPALQKQQPQASPTGGGGGGSTLQQKSSGNNNYRTYSYETSNSRF